MNVLSVAPYTGQFGSILDVKNINSLLLPFRVEKELEENALFHSCSPALRQRIAALCLLCGEAPAANDYKYLSQ
ncbi:hypothetical protein Trydic_g13146 [Trypoxylus dichotomus]